MRDETSKNAASLCTVLVCSCEKYSDLHKPFFEFMKRYWVDIPFGIALVTDTPGYSLEAPFPEKPFRIISTGYGKSWCEMLGCALDQIETPAVMLMMDDYFLSQPVRTSAVLERMETFFSLKALNLRLSPNPPPHYPKEYGVWGYEPNTAYSISCQTGFWDRVFLRNLASRFKSAWEFERKGSFALDEKEFRPLLATTQREFFYLDSVHKGYWEIAAIELAEQCHVELDFARRTLPPAGIKIKEWIKKKIFDAMPKNLLLKIQNALD